MIEAVFTKIQQFILRHKFLFSTSLKISKKALYSENIEDCRLSCTSNGVDNTIIITRNLLHNRHRLPRTKKICSVISITCICPMHRYPEDPMGDLEYPGPAGTEYPQSVTS
ncbi:hypothetical protein CDAR_386361 [Caerostris darwini]|uniref:Uncharacterized protein n=1 Tax=Caerostris darwini TaxID=1538125 RepID=A0AAV4QBT3_9ARAC|nr:hypothetical protein CDAR_386361 [Caerostris darwini]